MQTQTNLQKAERELMNIRFDSGTERTILEHWRKNQPKLVEELLSKNILKQTLTKTADRLLDMQISLEKTEKLPPAAAQLEAWRIVMRPVDDAKEEAEAWGMTVEEYLNRA
jgi:flagellar biosynthesis component FlhA